MEMNGRNEQTEIEDHTLVDIEEQATQHVVIAMKGKMQSLSGRQKTMDGRNEQTEKSEVNIRISSSPGITWRQKTMDGRNEISEVNIAESSSHGITRSLKRHLVGAAPALTSVPLEYDLEPAGSAPAWTSVPLEYDLESEPIGSLKRHLVGSAPAWTYDLESEPIGSLKRHLVGSAPAWTSVPLEYDLESEPIGSLKRHLVGAAPALTSVPLEYDLEPAGAAPDWTPMIGGAPMVTMKEKLGSLSDASGDRCIYRVPKHLRDTNEAAYVPRLVSLGPFHHGNENLKAMEDIKLRCFKSFIDRHHRDLDALLMLMKGLEEETKGFYADSIALSSDQFVQVILVDAIFVINFLLESNYSALAIHVESIYHKNFFWSVVSRDMMLLENQLPLSILEKILDFATSTTGTGKTEKRSVAELSNFLFNCHLKEEGSVTKLSNCLFNCHMKEERSVTKLSNCCLFNCHMKERRMTAHNSDMTDHNSDVTDLNSNNNARHFVDLQRLLYKPVELTGEPKNKGKFKKIKSITKLHEAGVRFRVASGKKLFHIEFKDGVLEIPGIVVSDPTESIFRNLSAYDQCHYGPSPIGDYFVLMGMLIDTGDDVDLLVKNQILQNDLATAQEVSKVFNSLEKEVFYKADSFYYSHLCEQLNEFCDIPWHKWMAMLKQNYLDTPWKVISLIAAFILLVLTMIQTVYSVISP